MPRLLTRLLACLPLLVSAGGCRRSRESESEPVRPEAAAALRGWHYTAALSPDLERLDVEVCFEGPPPRALVPGQRSATPYLEQARVTSTGRPLQVRDAAVLLTQLGEGRCVLYGVNLARMLREEDGGRRIRAVGESIQVRTSMWLWRPDDRPDGANVSLTLELPEGLEATVPWPTRTGSNRSSARRSFDLDTTAFTWLGYTAFGQLNVQRFEVDGTQVELAALDGPLSCDAECLRTWFVDAVHSSAILYGGYPRERLQAIVIPVPGGGEGGVYFGLATRGGGAGVHLLLDEQARADALPGGWTTVHELLHHGMPYIEQAWMAEGWVSYYTEITRTRMGHRTEAQGWQALYEAFERGRATRRPTSLQTTSDRMHETFAYQRVYWGGAAIAFFIDVALREDSANRISLDDAMKELRRCCGDAEHKWTAKALLQRLDRWYGKPLFSTIAEQHLRRVDFPPVEQTLARLGITVEDGQVLIDPEHPNAALRASIMAPRRP